MKRIKNYLLKVQKEFKGVSKGAIATVMLIEAVVCLILIATTLCAGINSMSANNLADNAIKVNGSLENEIYNLKVDRDSYKKLYEEAKEEIKEIKENNNP